MWERGVFVPARAKAKPPSRIRIAYPSPTVDGGRWPVKRTVADTVHVSADIFRDGHEVLRAVVRWREPGEKRWRESPLVPVDAHHNGVRWEGSFTVEKPGRTQWNIQAWVDLFAGWRDELARKVEFGQPDLSGELSEGAVLLRAAADRAKGEDERRLTAAAEAIATDPHAALDPALLELVESVQERSEATELPGHLEIDVDRTLARFGSWYELFPRSWGGFKGVQEQLPQHRRAGLRRPLHAADPPDRPHQPQGPQQHAHRRAGRPRQPLRDRRRDGRPRRDPPRARDRRGLPRAGRDGQRARPRHRPGPRDQLLARPPVAQGAPGVVLPPPRRHAQVRREPAQEVPGHLQRQLRLRGLARRSGTRCWPSCATGSTAA